MNALLKFSEGLRRLLEVVARASGWLLVIMAAVTCFDVLTRKIGLPLPFTKLQELEWHFHAALFSLWMGYGYTINAHPRVDSLTEPLTLRHKAWIELAGCLLLALPYTALVAYYRITDIRRQVPQNQIGETVRAMAVALSTVATIYGPAVDGKERCALTDSELDRLRADGIIGELPKGT